MVVFSANEWTLSISPLRVRKVAKMERRKVPITRSTFHIFSIPRFSWIITECRNAVPVSQGRSDAFSTGSQNQYPPHPSPTYPHIIPKMMPQVRKNHASSAHRRVVVIQRVSSRPERSAATQKAKGTVKAVKPRYSVGGWMVIQ